MRQHSEGCILKPGVTKAVAKGKQRLVLVVFIGPALHGVVVESRQVFHAPVESHRQATRWIHIAPQ